MTTLTKCTLVHLTLAIHSHVSHTLTLMHICALAHLTWCLLHSYTRSFISYLYTLLDYSRYKITLESSIELYNFLEKSIAFLKVLETFSEVRTTLVF